MIHIFFPTLKRKTSTGLLSKENCLYSQALHTMLKKVVYPRVTNASVICKYRALLIGQRISYPRKGFDVYQLILIERNWVLQRWYKYLKIQKMKTKYKDITM